MAATGYTPISLYYSTTASAVPLAANLANGELALNTADMKLYSKNSSGVVTLLASNAGASGTVSSVAVSGGTTGLTTSGGPITTSGTITLAGTLATANGGTNLTSFTSGGAVYATSTSALTTGTLPIASGGTGQTTASAAFNALSPITSTGDLILGNGVNSATRLAIGANGYVLTSNGTTASWSALAAGVSSFSAGTTGFTPSTGTTGAVTLAGTLATTNGGTGLTSFTAGGVVYANSSSALATGSGLVWSSVNNRLGVGTNSPQFNIHVYASGSGTTGGQINIQNNSTRAVGNSGRLTFQPNSDYTGTTIGAYIEGLDTTGSVTNNCVLAFGTGSGGTTTEKMRLDQSGNLGLGVTPSAWGGGYKAIDINTYAGFAATTTDFRIFANAYYNGTSWVAKTTGASSGYVLSAGQHLWSTAASATAGASISLSTLMTLDGSGNLGLGVTPSAWGSYKALQVNEASLAATTTNNTALSSNAYFDGTNWRYIYSNTATRYLQLSGAHSWHTAASGTAGNSISFTQAMTLDASGRLLLGNTSILGGTNLASFSNSVSAKSVLAIQNTSTSGYSSVELYNSSGTQTGAMGYGNASVAVTGAQDNVYLYSASAITFLSGGTTERARISAAGGFSVGTTADPGAGAIYATGAITAYYSDERLKDVKGRITNALAKVRRLSGVYYTNNDTAKSFGYDSDEVQVGVLAQEVEAVLPQVVKAAPFDLDENGNSKSGENYKTVQYEKLVPLLIEAINELQAKVKVLENK